MQDWTRGVVFVNGFNLGRYSRLSPYQTLYLPAPLLHLGQNKVRISFLLYLGRGSQSEFKLRLSEFKLRLSSKLGLSNDCLMSLIRG
jgi:hypothetical protein